MHPQKQTKSYYRGKFFFLWPINSFLVDTVEAIIQHFLALNIQLLILINIYSIIILDAKTANVFFFVQFIAKLLLISIFAFDVTNANSYHTETFILLFWSTLRQRVKVITKNSIENFWDKWGTCKSIELYR